MKRRLLPLGLAGILVACGGTDSSTADSVADAPPTTAAPTETAAAAEPADPAAGGVVAAAPTALQFTAPLLGGGDIEMASLAGRPVLLWFWAPW